MSDPRIDTEQSADWANWHNTSDVGGSVQKILTPFNEYIDGTTPPKGFEAGLAGLQSILADAKRAKVRLRAFGSKWSLNDIAYTDDYLVNCEQLDYLMVGVNCNLYLTEEWQEKKSKLAFVQSGVKVKAVNEELQRNNLALPTSGASNGQALVGAIATGTHGSAHDYGAMQEFVRGIHLVTDEGRHVFIQRESDPVVTANYCEEWLEGAELIEDDELFRAAIVSFGCFGFVHGLLIETEPLYDLGMYCINCDYNTVKHAISTLEMTGLGLPQGEALPFHFELVLNPYYIEDGQKGAFVRVYYKIPRSEIGTLVERSKQRHSADIVNFTQCLSDKKMFAKVKSAIKRNFKSEVLLDKIINKKSINTVMSGSLDFDCEWEPLVIPPILQAMLVATISPLNELIIAPPGEQFGDTTQYPDFVQASSVEIGVPFENISDALDLVLSVVKRNVFPAPLALRYVKNSDATLAFTRFEPITVTMEMPGIDCDQTRSAYEKIRQGLSCAAIPHTFHWGQNFPKDIGWLCESYGEKRIRTWLGQREKILEEEVQGIFVNELLENIGLF